MKILICLFVLASLKASLGHQETNGSHTKHPKYHTWKNHSSKFNLTFHSEEYELKAFDNFVATDELIEQHNNNTQHHYNLSHNVFSHWSDDDYKNLLVGNEDNFFLKASAYNLSTFKRDPNYILPASVDWVSAGWRTPIRDQGKCGGCWSFATTGAIQAAYWMTKKINITLAPEQLIECSLSYGNRGCNGGSAIKTFKYVSDYGLVEDQYYPYTAIDRTTKTCYFDNISKRTLYKISKFYYIGQGSDEALMEAVARFGPVVVGIDASGLKQYNSGIYGLNSNCSTTRMNHYIVLTGYGVDNKGRKYWTIKNSHGVTWGQNGYGNLSRDKSNTCGISTFAVVPFV